MKRKVWITLLLVLTAVIGLVAFASCKPETPPDGPGGENPPVTDVTEGAESGTYYFDAAENEEYNLSLSNGNKFTLLMRDVTRSGDYKLDGSKLTLTFAKPYEATVEATYADNAITLTYNNLTMRFLKKVYYTVSFDTHGGNEISSLSVINGKTLGKVADPVKSGAYFYGWYTDAEYKSPFLFDSQPVTSNLTLHARWVEGDFSGRNGLTVSFDLNYTDAEKLPDQKTVGGRILSLEEPTREGWVFTGWYVSQYDKADMLSYAVNADTVYEEDVTLYARWESVTTNERKLPTPRVSVNMSGLSWNSVGADSYKIVIEGPNGYKTEDTTTSLNYAVSFSTLAAGDYTITVTGTAGNTANNSNDVKLCWRNKALAKVSLFQVVEPSTLLFNAVDHAREYLIDIDCGNDKHVHSPISNGNSTYYNFANCSMQPGGIKFRVTARANGYLESVSKEFVYEKNLGVVENVHVNESEQVLEWSPVDNATNYILSIVCTNKSHNHGLVDVGNATSYSIKECGRGEITVKIYAKTRGYNSPVATEFTYNKTTIATPSNFRMQGTVLSWDAVDGAATYNVRIGGKQYTTDTNSYDLSKITDFEWILENDYQATVQALLANEPAANSLESDLIDMRYFALASSLDYSAGVLTWTHVIGSTKYEIMVNDAVAQSIESGENHARIKLTRGGKNVIGVRFYDDDQNVTGSDWAQMEVEAYTLEFDTRGGTEVPTAYYAYGDKLDLPTSTRPGYTFDAWYNVPGGAEKNGAEFDSEYYLEATDLRLYASWDSNKYKVKFIYGDERDQDDSAVHEGEVLYGKNYKLLVPDAPDDTVVFLGWYARQGGRGDRYTDQNGESLAAWNIIGDNTELYAYFAKLLEYTMMEEENYYSVKAGPGLVLVNEVRIPEEVNGTKVGEIPGYAFLNATNLKKVHIPNSIKKISLNAFSGCNRMEAYDIYATNTQPDDVVYRSDDSGVISALTRTTASGKQWELFLYPVGRAGDYTLPGDVTEIVTGVFGGTRISRIILPKTVTLVSNFVFQDCMYLREVIFEDSTDKNATLTIWAKAFQNCPNLRKVTLPVQLKTFGETGETESSTVNTSRAGVFVDCNQLEEIVFNGQNTNGFSAAEGMLAYNGNLIYVPAMKHSEKFTIPSGITGIGDNMFGRIRENGKTIQTAANWFTELEIPSWVTYIGKQAFYDVDQLQKITFKSSASGTASPMTIAQEAFWECSNLTEVVFEENCNVSKIQTRAFYRAIKLESLTIPKSVTEIGDEAFGACYVLKDLTFAAGGTALEIGKSVFYECREISELKLPAHVSKIEYGAFDGLYTSNITVADDCKNYKSQDHAIYGLENGTDRVDLVYYASDYDLTDGKLPETLKKIGDYVFRYNSNLTKVVIPASIEYIGAEAFRGASNLTSVKFENVSKEEGITFGTTTVDEISRADTFRGCTNLTELTLDGSMKTIPNGFLYMEEKGSSRMSTITLPEGIETIGDEAFYNATFGQIEIPATVKTIGARAFDSKSTNTWDSANRTSSLNKVTFAGVPTDGADGEETAQLESIGASAFYGLRATTIALPDSLKTVGDEAFSHSYLTSIVFGTNVQTIGRDILRTCTSLQSITISSDATVDGVMFNDCWSINALIFADGVTTIPAGLIEGSNFSSSLRIHIGATVTTISEKAFSSNRIASVDFPTEDGEESALTTIEKDAFNGASKVKTINLPAKVETIGDQAFMGSGLTTIALPKSLKSIGTSAFQGTKLTAVSVLEGGEESQEGLSIGDYAFRSLTTLRNVSLPKVNHLGTGVFLGSYLLSIVEIAEGGDVTTENNVIYTNDGKNLNFAPASLQGTVTVGSEVEKIEDYALSPVTTNNGSTVYGITGVTFEEGGDQPLHIGNYAFAVTNTSGTNAGSYLNSKLVGELKIPARCAEIGDFAFFGCSELTEITFEGESNSQLTKIGASAFNNCCQNGNQNFELKLPEKLEEIGDGAFGAMFKISKIEIPGSVKTIGKEAFRADRSNFTRSPLTTVEIKEGVTELGESMFLGCGNLTSVTLPASLTKIGTSAFINCTGLATLDLSNLTNLTTIGESAFSGCTSFYNSDTELVLPEALTTIENKAFSGCPIHKISLPASITTLGESVFENCTKLTTDGVKFPENSTSLTSIGKGMFKGAFVQGSGEFTLPSYVTIIGDNAFENANITKFTVSVGITEIGNYAFNGAKLTELTFADGCKVKTIGSYAFAEESLTTVTIPQSVTNIGAFAFYKMSSLTSVTFTEGTESLVLGVMADGAVNSDASVFAETGLTEISLPSRLTANGFGWNVFKDCTSLTSATLPGSLTSVPKGTFEGCTALASFEWPAANGVEKSIGERAFYGCAAFGTFTLPYEVTEIGDSAFYGFNAETFTFEQDRNNRTNLADLGEGAFRGTLLTTIDLTNCSALVSIKKQCFADSKLESITLNKSLLDIEEEAFSGCASLTTVTFNEGFESIGKKAFASCTALTTLNWGTNATVKEIGDGAFYGDIGFTGKFELPASVEKLGIVNSEDETVYSSNLESGTGTYVGVFSGCTEITEFDLSKATNLQSVGVGTFFNCTGISSITLPDSVTEIGLCVFARSGAKKITIPANLRSVNEMNNNNLGIEDFEGFEVTGEGRYSAKDGILYRGDRNTLVLFPQAKGLPYAENGNLNMEQVKSWFDGVTTLGDYSFYNTKLTDLELDLSGTSVTTLGDSALRNCGIKSLKTGGLGSVGEQVFRDNANLETLDVGEGTYSLGNNLPLSGCSKLETLMLPDSFGTIGDYFLDGTKVKKIHVSAKITSIGQSAFANGALETVEFDEDRMNEETGEVEPLLFNNFAFQNAKITSIELPEGSTFSVEYIEQSGSTLYSGQSLFDSCKSLTEVTLPSTIPFLPSGIFKDCSSMTTLNINEDAVFDFIARGAFVGCTSLTGEVTFNAKKIAPFTGYGGTSNNGAFESVQFDKITFGSAVETIAGNAFLGSGVQEVDMSQIEGKVTFGGTSNDGDSIFENCPNLEKVTMPKSWEYVDQSGNGYGFFENCPKLAEVVMNDVTSLNKAFFKGDLSSLKDVKFDEDCPLETIGESAFAGTAIESITLPDKVRSIGNSAFSGCTSLTSIKLPEELATLGNSVFSGCEALEEIDLPASLIDAGDALFSGCTSLTSIEGAEGLTTIGYNMFSGCTSLGVVPESMSSVTSIGEGAFSGCTALAGTIKFESVETITRGVFEGCALITSVEMKLVKNVPERAFKDCSALASIEFSNVLETIGESAFENCIGLETLTTDAQTIGTNAFKGCLELTTLTLNKAKTIGESAFESCEKLTTVALGNGCNPETIGDSAFKTCPELKEVALGSKLSSIGDNAFAGDKELELTLPDSLGSIGSGAFSGLKGISGLTNSKTFEIKDNALYTKGMTELIAYIGSGAYEMPEQVTAMRSEAFAGSGVTSIKVGKGLTNVPDRAFKDAKSLTSIDFANAEALTRIGNEPEEGGMDRPGPGQQTNNSGRVIAGCTLVTRLTIPAKVEIGDYAFADSFLTQITFEGEEEVEIPNYAFQNSKLTSFNGENVTSIGEYAFDGCSELDELELKDGVTIGQYAFRGCGLVNVVLPGNVTLNDGAFQNCEHLDSVKGGKTMTQIPNSLFEGCSALKTLDNDFWEGITNIGGNAFKDCKNLNDSTFKGHLDSITEYYNIGSGAFSGTSVANIDWLSKDINGLGSNWFENTNVTEFTIPDTVSEYNINGAFAGTNLHKLTFPNKALDLGYVYYLFRGLGKEGTEDLTLTINMPEAVINATKNGNSQGFYYGAWFQEINVKRFTVKLPDNMPNFLNTSSSSSYGLFHNSSCEEITIEGGEGITKLGDYAFDGCTSLKTLTLPSTITEISKSMFSGCTSLESLQFGCGEDCIGAADPTSADESVTLPQVTAIYYGAFNNCRKLGGFHIPKSCQSMDDPQGGGTFMNLGRDREDKDEVTLTFDLLEDENTQPYGYPTSYTYKCFYFLFLAPKCCYKDGQEITNRPAGWGWED